MKMNRFLAAATASVLAFGGLTLNSMPVKKVCAEQYGDSSLGEYVPELLELYKEYHKDTRYFNSDDIIELYFEKATSDESVFTIIEHEPDAGQIWCYVESIDEIDLEKLMEISGLGKNEMYLEKRVGVIDNDSFIPLSLNAMYPENNLHQLKNEQTVRISMKFYTYDHEANYNAAQKIAEYIKKNYKVDTANSYINLEQILLPKTKIYTLWNDMSRIDEYGIIAPLSEEFNTKQFKALNKDIAENGFKAVIDADTGNITFDDAATEVEKFTFALWFEEKYGFHAGITKLSYADWFATHLHQKQIMFYYTDLPGDVNNNEKVNLSDLVMLSRFLLNDRELINPKNADICEDGAIDGFDLTLLREMLIG